MYFLEYLFKNRFLDYLYTPGIPILEYDFSYSIISIPEYVFDYLSLFQNTYFEYKNYVLE